MRSTHSLVVPSYTFWMKTAISMPDDTFARASRRAQELGISRSEFFARAARRYLDELDSASITARIDTVMMRAGGGSDESSEDAVAAGRRVLRSLDDEW